MRREHKFLLSSIIALGFFLRLYGIVFDNLFLLHPDERAIVMFTVPLSLPYSIHDFFSVSSPLNPHFFAYGSFPLYLLKYLSNLLSLFFPSLNTYPDMALVGRSISTIADSITIFIVFLIAKKIFEVKTGLFSAFLYSIAVFPIQTSHFYAVDILLNTLIYLTILFCLKLLENHAIKNIFLIGAFFGLSLATKISSILLIIPVVLSLVFLLKTFGRKQMFKILTLLSISIVTAVLVFVLTEPYALIDWQTFLRQTQEQSQMTKTAFAFPYTLQYVGKTPYLYEIKNITLWGMGIISSILVVIGMFITAFKFKALKGLQKKALFIILSFTIIYFLIVGKFAVGWMRYMLPLYPLLCIFGGVALFSIYKNGIKKFFANSKALQMLSLSLLLVLCSIWTLSFMNIYLQKNTRVEASEWIHQNIPPTSKLAVEHWDDPLPLYGGSKYEFLTLPLYDVDTNGKWELIHATLNRADYIIISSNRLSVPLQKLTNCNKLPSNYCYSKTSQYYTDLFSEKLGFKKIMEFSTSPTIPFFNYEIDDQMADESFTVYDHPKVIIFKKQ